MWAFDVAWLCVCAHWCLLVASCCPWVVVGLLIFQLDAQVLPGGPFPHLSRWWDTQHSVTPSHTLQGLMCVCVSLCVSKHACMCVLFVSEISIHLICYIMYLLYAIWVKITLNQPYRICVHANTIATCTYAHPWGYAHAHTHTLLNRNWQPDTHLLI